MTQRSTLGVVGLVAMAWSAQVASAQAVPHYREFNLGASLASVLSVTGIPATDVMTAHKLPSLLQEVPWRKAFATKPVPEPAQQIVFGFFDGQLYRVVVDYEQERTEGLTDGDMVEAVSAMYGRAIKLAPGTDRTPASQDGEEFRTRVAEWGDADFSAVLYRSLYTPGYRMIVTSQKLAPMVRVALDQAIQLEARDAPLQERARQQKDAANLKASQEKARSANKGNFAP